VNPTRGGDLSADFRLWLSFFSFIASFVFLLAAVLLRSAPLLSSGREFLVLSIIVFGCCIFFAFHLFSFIFRSAVRLFLYFDRRLLVWLVLVVCLPLQAPPP